MCCLTAIHSMAPFDELKYLLHSIDPVCKWLPILKILLYTSKSAQLTWFEGKKFFEFTNSKNVVVCANFNT